MTKQEEATRALMNKWVSHVTSLTNRVDAVESDLLVQKKRYERLVQQCNDRYAYVELTSNLGEVDTVELCSNNQLLVINLKIVGGCNLSCRGLQLCERNEEAGILYEEINFLGNLKAYEEAVAYANINTTNLTDS